MNLPRKSKTKDAIFFNNSDLLRKLRMKKNQLSFNRKALEIRFLTEIEARP